jgi:hypothetical protein
MVPSSVGSGFSHPHARLTRATDDAAAASPSMQQEPSFGLGSALRSAAALVPDTLELAALVAQEAGHRGAQAVCTAYPASQRVCQAAVQAIQEASTDWQHWNIAQHRQVEQWRADHVLLDWLVRANGTLQDLQIGSSRWILEQAGEAIERVRRPAERLLVEGLGWTQQEARKFVGDVATTGLILSPMAWPRRPPTPLRLDYRSELWKHPQAFTGSSLFRGRLSEDLILVRYGTPESRAMWWTTHVQANALRTHEAVRDRLALLAEFGPRTHVTVARIPAGETFEALIGRAAPLRSKLTGEAAAGGGVQLKFAQFDPRWIRETRALPVSAPPSAAPLSRRALAAVADERPRVAALQRSLATTPTPRGLPAHLGMIRSSTETIPLHVQGPGVSLKGSLPFVRLEDGGAVLTQRTTRSSLFPKQTHGTGRFGNELFTSKGMTPLERAECLMRAAVHRAEQEGWKNLYVVWDPAKFPIATSLERLGFRITALGDLNAAGSSRKWLKISLQTGRPGKKVPMLLAGGIAGGAAFSTSDAQAAADHLLDPMALTVLGDARRPLHRLGSFTAPTRTQNELILTPRAQMAQCVLAVGDLLTDHAARLPGFIPPKALHTIRLLTDSSRFLQGHLSAVPGVLGAVGGLLRHRDMIKSAGLAGNVVSALASHSALLQATSPLTALVPGVGFALSLAGIFHSILSWDDDDDEQEQLEAFFRDLQQAGADLSERVHQRLVQEVEEYSRHASEVLHRQGDLAQLVNEAQLEARGVQELCVQQCAQLGEREAEALSQMRVVELDLQLDAQTFGQRLAVVSSGVQRLMLSVQDAAQQLERRVWEQPLLDLELFHVRTPRRAMRASELAKGLDALRSALSFPLEDADVLRLASAALQLRIRAHRAGLPNRQVEPIIRQYRDRLRLLLEKRLETSAPELANAWADELLHLLSLSELPDEVCDE